MTEETRRKISESCKGQCNHHVPHTEETKKKMSEAHKAITDETRRKMSEAHKGKPSGHKGHHHSEESKKKIAKAVHLASLEKHPYPGTWIKNV